ncbi:MAG: septum formation initiator family protein [Candidatus Pacebacteria bacterium]|nr:septum formation initiator family protein [Candidatus Paceibacterota bacterium]
MAEFKKKDKNNFWYSPLSLVLLFVFIIFLIYSIIGLIKKDRETAKKKEIALSRIEALEEREDSLKKDISKLETEEGLEDVIRNKLPVVKEGEKMVVIVDEEEITEEGLIEDDKIRTENNFLSWLKSLFNK